ncbi:hypothetical protein [uncultured Veillonella sp.]|uniref:hypothetical protein n=1 Tax=uncultured Veillonella sp. TaxID=159268 RepID=UPI00262BCCC4|nr:hypothetical protein [uncultured Veillonella sp.]
MKCKSCGHEQPQGKFCSQCGGNLVNEAVAGATSLDAASSTSGATASSASATTASAVSTATPSSASTTTSPEGCVGTSSTADTGLSSQASAEGRVATVSDVKTDSTVDGASSVASNMKSEAGSASTAEAGSASTAGAGSASTTGAGSDSKAGAVTASAEKSASVQAAGDKDSSTGIPMPPVPPVPPTPPIPPIQSAHTNGASSVQGGQPPVGPQRGQQGQPVGPQGGQRFQPGQGPLPEQGMPAQGGPQGGIPGGQGPQGRKLYERNDKVHIIVAIILVFVLWGSSWMLMFSSFMSASNSFGDEYGIFDEYTYEDSRDTDSHKRDTSKTEPKGKTATPTPVQTATPAPKPDPLKVDAEQAQRAFNQYHQYITARNYTAAYNQFTDQFKNQAGDVNAWASGFATTKESVVDSMNVVSQNNNQIVINFVLHATDYEGSGTVKRSFTGQATMVKVNNRWLIDSIEARQL